MDPLSAETLANASRQRLDIDLQQGNGQPYHQNENNRCHCYCMGDGGFKSSLYDYLCEEFFKYVAGKSSGGAILVCGHRGSGKTTVIYRAFVTTLCKSSKNEIKSVSQRRPLLVRLPAAKLLDDDNTAVAEPAPPKA